MLKSLVIKNYALIDEIQVEMGQGLSIITGETGAGKSIVLGALSLILGKRADLTTIKNTSKKCIVEGTFDIANYGLKSFFDQADLDFDSSTILRREILPSGKSRAFINDSPVNLDSLQLLGSKLIDIHSQHENLKLSENDFQFKVIDAFAKNDDLLNKYTLKLNDLKRVESELNRLNELKSKAIREQDYNSFLLNELVDANLVLGELDMLEEQQQKLSNIDFIREHFKQALQVLKSEDYGVLDQLNALKNSLSKISDLNTTYHDIYQRINSNLIELEDISSEIENEQEQLDLDPSKLEEINTKLQLLLNLLLKHSANSVDELIAIRDQLSQDVQVFESIDDDINNLQNEAAILKAALDDLAAQLHTKRLETLPTFTLQLTDILSNLGMPNARFKIEVKQGDVYFLNGKDELSFLFTANKGEDFKQLKKVASGGEISRLMLAIKSILGQFIQLPTIIFDEVDAGVSGEISSKMGVIMKTMSAKMQVIAITHLPQIAAKGDTHYKVFKEDNANDTVTKLMRLNADERIVEIAEMLGGEKLTASAMAHAKQLLN